MFGGFFGALGGGFYDQNFRAYPVAFIEKESAEAGDKVILPPSSLNTLASMQVEYPMLFRVENKRGQRVSHCGVLEFIAQEGMLYMPQWMMDNLLLSVGDLVNLKNVSLPKGSFIKIQPHTSDFLDIANPKAVLETSLRSFTCLTQGDTIVIPYNGRKYYIDIVEVKPDQAVSVVETDVEVDFAPPKDYKEPDYKALAAAAASAKPASALAGPSVPGVPPKDSSAATPDPESEEPKFAAFSGKGNRLDGRASSVAPVGIASRESAGAQSTSSASTGGQAGNGTLRSGTVVFGNPAGAPANKPSIPGNRLAARLAQSGPSAAAKPQVTSEEKQEDPKFVAFGGKGRSLKD